MPIGNDGLVIAFIASVGTLGAAYIALRTKKGEKADDASIAREAHAWEENKDLRARLTECQDKVQGLRDQLLEAKDKALRLQDELDDALKKSLVGGLEKKPVHKIEEE